MPRIYKGSETILKLLIDVPSTSVIDKIKIALFTTDRSIAMEFYADSITLYGNIAYLNAPEWTFMEMQDGIINYIAQGESNSKPFIFERQSNYILKSSDGFEMSEIMNGYYTKEETDVKLEAEQDKLVSGKTIKTINGESVLGSGNITIETDLTGYATEQYVNDAIANIDIPEGTGGATKYVIDLRDDDGYSMYRLDANMFLQEDKICYVRYVKYNTENGTEYFQSILNGGRYENPSEFIPYVWSIIDDKLFTWDFSDGSVYAIPTITPIGGGSGEGGDSGAYILEGVEPIFEAEFWYSPETGEVEMIYETNSEYSTSEERKAHNKKVIDAILEGKCKSLYYKKFVGNVDEKIIEVDENGREHRKTVNGYQYFPLSWTEYEMNWGLEYIRFEGKFIEGYMHTPKERVIVLNKETAEIQADSQMTYAIGNFMDMVSVSFIDEYKMERRIYDIAISNTKPVCLNIEGESTISRCFLKTKLKNDFDTNTEQGIVWCDDVDGNRYEWLFEYNFDEGLNNEFAIPTITPIGGGSGDSYTKAEIDGMIGDINNILETI